jgi:hypothetical protein
LAGAERRSRRERYQSDEPEDEPATELTPARVMAVDDALELLEHGELSVEGQVVDASNATLYLAATLNGVSAACAYKPVSGERPLWDFPDGTLAEREVAAYAVSAATGWNIVPPTILREGPFGLGMLQLWIDVDPDQDVRRMIGAGPDELRRIAVFDAVINNGDRKGGHLLPVPDGHVYGIDHGVTFNVDDKLRTVVWNWAGEALNESEVEVLRRLRADFDVLAETLDELLTTHEIRKTRHRIDRLLRSGVFSQPSRDWPPIPWPSM